MGILTIAFILLAVVVSFYFKIKTKPNFYSADPHNFFSDTEREEGFSSQTFPNVSGVYADDIDEKKNTEDSQGRNASLKKLMGWIYPGAPACDAMKEITDGRRIDVIKPEYFRVDHSGELLFLDQDTYGCNGYSSESVKIIKEYSEEQFVTVSSASFQAMEIFLNEDLSTGRHIETLLNFVVDNDLTGIELDFEEYSSWSVDLYNKYKEFIVRLGDRLHENQKKLMVDGPAISSEENASWYVWDYHDFIDLPVDYVVVMAYDYQFDYGAGVPVSPLSWIEDVVVWTKSKFPDRDRLVIGIPSYGYKGELGTNQPTLITYEQARGIEGFDKASRHAESSEMFWVDGDKYYSFQNASGIAEKIDTVLNSGIYNVSIWHLGGNKWPDK